MTVTSEMILQVRRWTGEVQSGSGSIGMTDAEIEEIILRYPCIDSSGEVPYLYPGDEGYIAGSGGGLVSNPDWVPTYDLHHTSADIWDGKAASAAAKFSFSADGASYNRNQVYLACTEQAAIHRSLTVLDQIRTAPLKVSSDEDSIAFEDRESGEDI